MTMQRSLRYILLFIVVPALFTACRKDIDCTNSSANLPSPIPMAKFRVVNSAGQDMFATGDISYDSLMAHQPCTEKTTLNKNIKKIGEGGLESYVIYFSDARQPITGENKECFTVELKWSATDMDVIEFISRTEHHPCGITYHLDGVKFNGVDAATDNDGYFLLRK